MTQAYHANIVGEDRMEFTSTTYAATRSEARQYFEEQYPEGRVDTVYTEQERIDAENARYQRLERMIAEDDYFDEDF